MFFEISSSKGMILSYFTQGQQREAPQPSSRENPFRINFFKLTIPWCERHIKTLVPPGGCRYRYYLLHKTRLKTHLVPAQLFSAGLPANMPYVVLIFDNICMCCEKGAIGDKGFHYVAWIYDLCFRDGKHYEEFFLEGVILEEILRSNWF